MRINYARKRIFYLTCTVLVITLLKNIRILNVPLWNWILHGGNVPEYYILLWTSPRTIPFQYLGEGSNGFVSRKCPYTNCIVTSNRSLLGDYSLFDAILFHGPEIINLYEDDLPKKRLPKQKYVFASIESSAYYPMCSNRFDGYFNWTWTYRLESEVRWGYIVARDSDGNIVGPEKEMNWLPWKDMQHVSKEIKDKFKSKTRTAAWFVSNCLTKSRREGFVMGLKRHLLRNYNLHVDMYGSCSTLKCPRENQEKCYNMIDTSYYFYFAFENAFSPDYVTEKLLIPLQHNAIPIVYGGANYSRFLPNGSYLNARELGFYKLVEKMVTLVYNPDQYAEYFRWKSHYSFHNTSESVETNEYCQMCALLNDDSMRTQESVYQNFRDWWDPADLSC